MDQIKVTDKLVVSAQPSLAAFADLKKEGFTALINNRPDGEEKGQPQAATERWTAKAAGLGYSFIPVSTDDITEADARAFHEALNEAQGPVLAYCGSGLRSIVLYAIGEVLDGRMQAREVRAFGDGFGLDLAPAVRWLASHEKQRPVVKGFFEPKTSSVQYIATDPQTGHCAIIDPVLDYNERAGATATTSADALLAHVAEQGLEIAWILDTHPHADHFSAAHYLKEKTGAPMAIGAHVTEVQRLWKDIYHWPGFPADGSQWDRLFKKDDRFAIGSLEARVLFSPGHTLASITYVVGDAAFVHDTLFMPDGGTARADFPGGSAQQLWTSIQEILALPEKTRVFTGHDYQPQGRQPRWESTVGEQKRANIHLAGKDEAAFVELREARDRGLPMPALILESLQVNMCGGRLPEPESNGRRYLKIPLNALDEAE
ncbi:MAG: bifunctional sulfur transferase/dioxygenase Blh [Xanthobacteraceae bacterium]